MELLHCVIILLASFFTVPPISGKLVIPRYKGTLDSENMELEPESRKMGHLLIQKRLRNSFVVEGLDLIVEYNIFNVGTIVTHRVHLKDPSFEDESQFIRVSGFTDVNLGQISPRANVSHVIVVRPLRPGNYNLTGAQITYSPGQGEDDITGTSSEPGSVLVHSSIGYHRKFSPHYEEWTAFAVLVLPSLIIPYMLWFSSQSKYERLIMLHQADKMRKVLHCRRD